ncbi:MAG TPA: alpha/beta fold hydrolase [Thermoanaerobaculia bacterium]|nr:alpha/beta fold hydrolase [Thermoanaerobaculia bacterium]
MTVHVEAPPYVEERLALDSGGWRIPAVLTSPRDGKPVSAVLLVPGSLFLDADGNMPFMNIYPHTYADLARQLAGQGHAVLRFAKRGPGTGSEKVDEEAAARHRGFRSHVDVARAALDALLARVDAPAVLAGHSEGAVVATLLAAEDGRVHGVVTLSGPATGIFAIMREQLPLPEGSPPEAYATFDRVVADVRAGQEVSAETLAAHPTTAGMSQIGPEGLRYLAEVDAIDPAQALARIEAPVLVLQGGRDPSVREHHARTLAQARGSRPTEIALFPELQHFYKRVPAGLDPFASFAVSDESDPAVAEAIAAWIRKVVVKGGR